MKQARRPLLRGLALAVLAFSVQACNERLKPTENPQAQQVTDPCTPSCAAGCGTDDGCGGVCPCDANELCSAGDMAPTCASERWTCGDLCGVSCGSCAEGSACLGGQCVVGSTCEDCPLSLSVTSLEPGRLRVGVDFSADASAPRPRVADLRLRVSDNATLIAAFPGDALTSVQKALYQDSTTGRTFRRREDGTYQLLAYGLSTAPFRAGRLVDLTFSVTGADPIAVALERNDKTFAPPRADAALQVTDYDRPVVVAR